MVGSQREGWALLAVMASVRGRLTIVYWAEARQPRLRAMRSAPCLQSGGNMEGKEVRFGIAIDDLGDGTTGARTAASTAMHDSYMPLGGGAAVHYPAGRVISAASARASTASW